jgi:hypothetical protein
MLLQPPRRTRSHGIPRTGIQKTKVSGKSRQRRQGFFDEGGRRAMVLAAKKIKGQWSAKENGQNRTYIIETKVHFSSDADQLRFGIFLDGKSILPI